MARKVKDTEAPVAVQMDPKEEKEREEAAYRYSEEDDSHLVEFVNECIKVSVQSNTDIRRMQEECWRVYQEEEPDSFYTKEVWQTRVTYPKPYKLVQTGSAIIRKIFEMEFLSVDKKGDEEGATFWKELLTASLGRNYANFPIAFADATGMALYIRQSMEMIPYWLRGRGLQYALVEPGKIHRDPDALSRQPHSGEWWIHQELMGLHHLKDGQKKGRYKNIDKIPAGTTDKSPDPNITSEEIARRKNQIWQRSKFHHGILTMEFWGIVLDPKGNFLLPNATYTLAADKVISPPKVSPYPNLRWPGVGFSALPHMLRWDGRGLIQGIRSLWYLMCNLASLHADHMNWAVNPMMEMDINSLVNQDDIDIYPGKLYQTHQTVQGQQVVRPVDFKTGVGDMLAYLNFIDQRHQDGGLMDYSTMGLPGYRAEVTKGEAAQNLDQSMILVGAMGKNIEDGALDAIMAAAETIMINMTAEELADIMGPDVAAKYERPVSDEFPTGLELPKLGTGTFHVSGISGVMKDQEVLKHLLEMQEVFKNELFTPYLEPYFYLKALEKRMYLQDEQILISDAKYKQIAEAQQKQQEAAIEHKAGQEELGPEALAAKAAKDRAMAGKAEGEGASEHAQADLFTAKAGEIMAGGAEGAPPEGAVQ